MHTENQSRPGRTWLQEGRGGRHVSQEGGLCKDAESNEPLWRVFPPKNSPKKTVLWETTKGMNRVEHSCLPFSTSCRGGRGVAARETWHQTSTWLGRHREETRWDEMKWDGRMACENLTFPTSTWCSDLFRGAHRNTDSAFFCRFESVLLLSSVAAECFQQPPGCLEHVWFVWRCFKSSSFLNEHQELARFWHGAEAAFHAGSSEAKEKRQRITSSVWKSDVPTVERRVSIPPKCSCTLCISSAAVGSSDVWAALEPSSPFASTLIPGEHVCWNSPPIKTGIRQVCCGNRVWENRGSVPLSVPRRHSASFSLALVHSCLPPASLTLTVSLSHYIFCFSFILS